LQQPGVHVHEHWNRAVFGPAFPNTTIEVAVPVIPLGDQALTLIAQPAGASVVSLRGEATDLASSSVEEAIIRAYPVMP
jgi:hypothetical protein